MSKMSTDAALKTLEDLVTEPIATALGHMSRTVWAYEEESHRLARDAVDRGTQLKVSKELHDRCREAANAAVVFTMLLAMAAGEDPEAMNALAKKLIERNNRVEPTL